MGVWVCIVEGDGEKEAVPLLLRRIVYGKFGFVAQIGYESRSFPLASSFVRP